MFKTNRDLGLLLLRVGISGMMLVHGIPKISKLFESPIEFADPFGIGALLSLILTIIGEVVAPAFIIVGYKTKLAAIPATITMLVAAFIVHGQDDFYTKEKALLYGLGFLVIAIAGSGKYAIDKNS